MLLNLGCGFDTRGEVRIDKNPERTGANLIADAHFIPLRDKIVKIVYAHSVIEHLESAFRGLLEMVRVAREKIIVIVPNVHNIGRIWKTLRAPLSPVNTGTLHFQGWDTIEFKHLVDQVEGLEILRFGWGSSRLVRARKLRFNHPLLSRHMIVEMGVAAVSQPKPENPVCLFICPFVTCRYIPGFGCPDGLPVEESEES